VDMHRLNVVLEEMDERQPHKRLATPQSQGWGGAVRRTIEARPDGEGGSG